MAKHVVCVGYIMLKDAMSPVKVSTQLLDLLHSTTCVAAHLTSNTFSYSIFHFMVHEK